MQIQMLKSAVIEGGQRRKLGNETAENLFIFFRLFKSKMFLMSKMTEKCHIILYSNRIQKQNSYVILKIILRNKKLNTY